MTADGSALEVLWRFARRLLEATEPVEIPSLPVDLDGDLATAMADLAAVFMARAERERAMKLRALAQLASSIGHDLGNILNPLGLQLQLIERRLDKDRETVLSTIASMRDVLKVGVELAGRLRSFSRQDPERVSESLDLNEAAGTALGLGRARAGQHGVEVADELGAPPRVRATGPELVSAIVNLITNAGEAMAGAGGRIVVRTGEDAGGGWVEVEDDGPGMPPEVERRVFEPFFSTKKEGTGLGLATVYAFVQRQGGRMTLETAPGKGARFRLWFPVYAGSGANG